MIIFISTEYVDCIFLSWKLSQETAPKMGGEELCSSLQQQLCAMERSTELGHRKESGISDHPSVCVCGCIKGWCWMWACWVMWHCAVWVRRELGGCLKIGFVKCVGTVSEPA